MAQALAFRPVALGIVPAGSGNGLARELGVPRRPADALRAALSGVERVIDAGELEGRLFVHGAGIGFDAHVAARFNARPAGRRGLWPYLALGLRELLRYRAADCTVRLDDATVRRRALLAVCANARQYGGGARIAPDARPDDGLLDVVVVADQLPLRRLMEVPRLFAGTLAALPGVLVRRSRAVEVTADRPLPVHVDGESLPDVPRLTGRTLPGALRVRVPAPAPAARPCAIP